MSNRIVKSKKTSTENRRALSHLLTAFNVSKMPCSNCVTRGREHDCVLNPDKSNRCEPCVKAGYSCDGHGLSMAAGERLLGFLMNLVC